MYEDSWYALVPEHTQTSTRSSAQSVSTKSHKRKESLLQQPNGTQNDGTETLRELYEEPEPAIEPPEPTLTRRAKSYSDFYHVVRAQLAKDATATRKKKRKAQERTIEALMVTNPDRPMRLHEPPPLKSAQDQLLESTQQEFLLYRDQLDLTARHLDGLIGDANGTLELLTTLADSFRAVESQTTTFKAQCDDLIFEERRLQKLADEVGTDLHYYAYLDGATRRLNAPGASRLVDHENFGEILRNLDACIGFMAKHSTYRDAESYLARYQSLLTKALHLVEVGFSNHLDRISLEVSKQILSNKSEATRHAVAYGRFEQMVLYADGLVINVQRVMHSCFDQYGNPILGQNFDYYANTASNIFSSYLSARDRDMRPIVQHDLDIFRKDAKESSVETASRNFIKQCYERSFNETNLLAKMFGVDPHFSPDSRSAYANLKALPKSLVNVSNIGPVATTIQPLLQSSELHIVCNLLGWITNEYLIMEYDEEESRQSLHYHEITSRLLTEHLWPVTDNCFENEVVKSITKDPMLPDTLKIGPVVDGVASSNAYPVTKRALELLALYDQAMPKERSQKSNPVVYRIVHETMLALQRVETRLKGNKAAVPEPDPDLFMIKNLLILKNGLLSLEIGDVRAQPMAMQHFGQIWDTLSPQNWLGMFRGILGGSLSLGLWSTAAAPATNARATASQPEQDAGERLDELLRQNIYSFTQRWGTLIQAAKTGRRGAQSLDATEKELDDKLATAFGDQSEVVDKLKEAIEINAQAQKEAKGSK